MSRPARAVARAGALAAAAALAALAGCTLPPRTSALLEGSFGAGVRVPARQDDESPFVAAGAAVGGVKWWQRGGDGPLRHWLGLGGTFVASYFDLTRLDLGGDLVLVPPRGDRRTGFQFRLGPRFSADGEHGGGSFSAEWYDAWLGGLFAEAQYDFVGHEAAFLVGARVNLLFPVTYVRMVARPLD